MLNAATTYIRRCLLLLGIFCAVAAAGNAQAPNAAGYAGNALNVRAFEHMSLGFLYEMQGNYPAAILEYQDALRYDSTAVVLHYSLFENFVRLQKREQAVQALRAFVLATPDDERAVRILMALLKESQRLVDAESVLQTLLRTHSGNITTLRMEMLDLALKQNERKEAAGISKQLIKAAEPNIPPFDEIMDTYNRNGKTAECIDLLDDYRKSYQDEPDFLYALGQAYFVHGDTLNATKYFQQIYEKAPNYGEIEPLLFDLYLAQNKFDQAAILIDRLEMPRRLELGRRYLKNDQLEEAEQLFTQLTDTPPRTWSLYYAIGRMYLDTDNFTPALDYLLKAETIDTSATEQYYFISITYARMDSLAHAEQFITKALEREPDSKEFINFLGGLYLDQDKPDDAIAMWGSIVASGKADARQYYLLGLAFNDADQFDDSESNLRTAIRMEPKQKIYQNALGQILMGQRKFVEAITHFGECLLNDPADTRQRYLLAVAHFQHQDYYQAIEQIDLLLELDPKNVDALAMKGDALAAVQDFPNAEKTFKQVIVLRPDHALVLNNYSYLLAERGERLEEALEMSRKAVDDEPENTSYLDTLGWIYYKLGQYPQALEFVRRAVELEDDSAVILEHLGDIYEKMDDMQNAQRYWGEALKQDPNNQKLQEKLKNSHP
jgi:tetratricopeptide (TPR) repeat protein